MTTPEPILNPAHAAEPEQLDAETERSPWGITVDLVPDPSSPPTLAIKNNSRVNRPLATHSNLSPSSYSAYLRHVQYGLYHSKPSCLLAIDFSFRFPANSSSRFSSAEIMLTFTHARAHSKPSLPSKPASDPIVANFAPVVLLGRPHSRTESNTFEIAAPLTLFNTTFGPAAGVTPRWAVERIEIKEGQAEVHGCMAQDDEHVDGANSVAWDMTESPVKKEGIFRSFRGVVMLHLRNGEGFWMRVDVKPVVKFSLNPKKMVFAQRLIGKRDEPVLLDGETELIRDPVCAGHHVFDADDFPWDAVLKGSGALGER
ncbi:hypothetical protein QBC40DRAFT_287082 [Triangularia verruculosa]|uniref:Uncharacterized protein n=1 Tax=Triangularia verruculosa TaxID=2587418 RepID=A0AAN7ARM9_9PEZI|nr:hypothetical protein QBC40DRAFT_287082 [Triangularia verruculosa]